MSSKKLQYNELENVTEYLSGASSMPDCGRAVRNILNSILVVPGSVSAVWHPLGFMYLQLRHETNRTLRIHIWSPLPGEYTGLGWLIHKHNWSLSSYIICGQLENNIYNVSHNSDSPTHKIYAIEYLGLINRLRATDRFVLCKGEASQLQTEGSCYKITPGVFHATVVKSEVVATMVLATDAPDTTNEVLGDISGAASYLTERRPCCQKAVRRAIHLVLETMN